MPVRLRLRLVSLRPMKQKRTRNLHPAGMGAKTCSGFASALYSRQAGALLISSTIQRVHVAIPYIIGPQSYCSGSAFMDPLGTKAPMGST